MGECVFGLLQQNLSWSWCIRFSFLLLMFKRWLMCRLVLSILWIVFIRIENDDRRVSGNERRKKKWPMMSRSKEEGFTIKKGDSHRFNTRFVCVQCN